MSYRTSVGFCVKPHIKVPKFEDIEKDAFDDVIRDERGTLFASPSIKWYKNSGYELIDKVEDFLESLNEDDYYFVEVDTNVGMGEGCDEIKGCWFDNPFNLGYVHELRYDV